MSNPRAVEGGGLFLWLLLLLTFAGASGVAHAQSADEVAKANNPLAPITAINFQNYNIPSIYALD